MRTTRNLAVMAALVAATCVGCSSSGSTANPGTSTSSPATTPTGLTIPTTAPVDPDLVPNAIPFDVGEMVARSHDWRMSVTKVLRPLTAVGLAALPAGQQYVGVDFTLINDGTASVTVNARKIFGLVDAKGRVHKPINGAQGVTGLDGTYAPGSTHAGRLIFVAPAGQHLIMALDGPAIHTQRTVFQIDPPTHPAND